LFYLLAYLFPLATGLLISPTGTFHLIGSKSEHATNTGLFAAQRRIVGADLTQNLERSAVFRPSSD